MGFIRTTGVGFSLSQICHPNVNDTFSSHEPYLADTGVIAARDHSNAHSLMQDDVNDDH